MSKKIKNQKGGMHCDNTKANANNKKSLIYLALLFLFFLIISTLTVYGQSTLYQGFGAATANTTLSAGGIMNYNASLGRFLSLDFDDSVDVNESFFTIKAIVLSTSRNITMQFINNNNITSVNVTDNTITYYNAYNATDIKYEVLPYGIRKTITLHNGTAPRNFTFKIVTNTLNYTSSHGSVVLRTSIGNIRALEIVKPYGYDNYTINTTNSSGDIIQYVLAPRRVDTRYAIRSNENGLFLDLFIDTPFEQLSFPVTIDPSVLSGSTIEVTGKGNTMQTLHNEINNTRFFNYDNATGFVISTAIIKVIAGGELNIYNVSLNFNSSSTGEFYLQNYGNLSINYSRLTSLTADGTKNYYIEVNPNTTFNAVNSNFTSIGSGTSGTTTSGISIDNNHSVMKHNKIFSTNSDPSGGYLVRFVSGTNHTFENNTLIVTRDNTNGVIISPAMNNSLLRYNVINMSTLITTADSAIEVSGSNITISNNTIAGKGLGIDIDGSRNITAENNTIDMIDSNNITIRMQNRADNNLVYNNILYGIASISNSRNVNISFNLFNITRYTSSSTGLAAIELVSNTSFTVINNNNFSISTGLKSGRFYAITTSQALYNNITFNKINGTDNTSHAIYLQTGSNNTYIISNIIGVNGTDIGVWLQDSNNNSLFNNNITMTNSDKLSGGGDAIKIQNANNNSIYLNTIYVNITGDGGGDCIAGQGSLQNRMYNNTFSKCFGYTITLDKGTNNSLIFMNNFTNKSNIIDDGFNNSWNTSSSEGGGNLWQEFDRPIEGCLDINTNDFCDIPVNVTNTTAKNVTNDYLPRISLLNLKELNVSTNLFDKTIDSDTNTSYTITIRNDGDGNQTENITVYVFNFNNADTAMFNDTSTNFTIRNIAGRGTSFETTLQVASKSIGNYTAGIRVNISNDALANSSINITTSIINIFFLQNFTFGDNLTALFKGAIIGGDVNNDSYNDVIIFGDSSSCTDYAVNRSADCFGKVFINNGTALAVNNSWGINLTGLGQPSGALADIDRDGDTDLVAMGRDANKTIYTQVFLNNGTSFAEDRVWGMNATDLYLGNVQLGYINEDGLIDLFITGCNSTSCPSSSGGVYTNNGTSFIYNNTYSNNITFLAFGSSIFTDADNDNDLDLVMSGCPSTNDESTNCGSGPFSQFYENNGTSYVTNSTWSVNFVSALASIASGDIDNDRDMDLAWYGYNGTVFRIIYQNNGSGFVRNTTWEVDLDTAARGEAQLGDVNNDGKLDLAVAGCNTGSSCSGTDIITKIYTNNGTSFASNSSLNNNLTALDFSVLLLMDLNNDTKLDMILTGNTSSQARSFVYTNKIENTNTRPNRPQLFFIDHSDNIINFSWTSGNDTETPNDGLYYRLRIGSSSGARDVISEVFGFSSKPAAGTFGNMQQMRNITLGLDNSKKYFWCVETIDTSFSSSGCATEWLFEPSTSAAKSSEGNGGGGGRST